MKNCNEGVRFDPRIMHQGTGLLGAYRCIHTNLHSFPPRAMASFTCTWCWHKIYGSS